MWTVAPASVVLCALINFVVYQQKSVTYNSRDNAQLSYIWLEYHQIAGFSNGTCTSRKQTLDCLSTSVTLRLNRGYRREFIQLCFLSRRM